MKKIICLVLFLGMITISFPGCMSELSALLTKEICLNDYVTVEFSGNSEHGKAKVTFDQEKFYLDNTSKIAFKNREVEEAFKAQHNHKIYKAMYGDEISPISVIYWEVFDVEVSKKDNLVNGEEIKLVWNIDYDRISKYFDIKLTANAETYIVSGLGCRYQSINEIPQELHNLAQNKRDQFFSNKIHHTLTSLTLTDIYYLNDYSLNFIYVGESKYGWTRSVKVTFYDVYYKLDNPTKAFYSQNASNDNAPSLEEKAGTYSFKEAEIIDHITK